MVAVKHCCFGSSKALLQSGKKGVFVSKILNPKKIGKIFQNSRKNYTKILFKKRIISTV
jgi:hypothetical protein